ncbi:hypothetical protein CDD80_2494 [Ophiocordyceps camponoti-rufipedis]|uniref:Uncharacterized protein n=1 Tax=Ophiocordyceps camponoti-rufipedis TaxID=2004952 RepID=A0A2C5Z2M3_9HYPO|nr:hypothetical protein CDD80_2494 [Ophiocordyceps camponoti-rufipedis]
MGSGRPSLWTYYNMPVSLRSQQQFQHIKTTARPYKTTYNRSSAEKTVKMTSQRISIASLLNEADQPYETPQEAPPPSYYDDVLPPSYEFLYCPYWSHSVPTATVWETQEPEDES